MSGINLQENTESNIDVTDQVIQMTDLNFATKKDLQEFETSIIATIENEFIKNIEQQSQPGGYVTMIFDSLWIIILLVLAAIANWLRKKFNVNETLGNRGLNDMNKNTQITNNILKEMKEMKESLNGNGLPQSYNNPMYPPQYTPQQPTPPQPHANPMDMQPQQPTPPQPHANPMDMQSQQPTATQPQQAPAPQQQTPANPHQNQAINPESHQNQAFS